MWPNKENKNTENPEAPNTPVKVEKTPAELIAEALAPHMKTINDGFVELRSKVEAIEGNTKRPEPQAQPSELPSVFDDENAAFATRMTPIMLRQLELEARVVKGDIKREYEVAGFGDLWSQYGQQIDNTLDSSPLVDAQGKVLRGNPDYIRNTVDMIFGRAARQAGMRFDGKNKSFFLEGASGDGSNTNDVHAAEEGITAAQLKVFNRMKIPLADAKKTLEKMQFIT